MSVNYGAISISSNVLAILGYFPEIYSTIYDVEVKTTFTWIIWGLSGILGISYGVCIENPYVITSSCIGTGLNILLVGVKHWKLGRLEKNESEPEYEIDNPEL
jgi:hypothetical protein